MKAIRKCDEKVTAQQLGVKVGDKFVVLPRENSYKYTPHYSRFSRVGDIITLIVDDNTCSPYFRNDRTGIEFSEHFACLALYRAQKQSTALPEELSLSNVKFDMKAIAEELGVSLETAHNIVQTALFEKGVEWVAGYGQVVRKEYTNYLYVNHKSDMMHSANDDPDYKLVHVKPQYSFYVKEEVETIEFNGKQYKKDDVAKVLALLSPINNA